jgi:nascent polypeptide-associated complex subunit alpha
MQQAMKRMGISQVDVPANEVIIRQDDKELVIANPQVAKVSMMGQETYQVVGEAVERSLSTEPDISEDDIKTVMEQASVDEETAKKAIEETNGDLAEAIVKLSEE